VRCVSIARAGGYDRLELVERPDPVPGPGESLVHVRAASVNFADCVVRMGLYASAKEYVGWPITPGFDLAGTTEGGRRVFGVTRFGAYATRVAVPDVQLFDPLPGWDDARAAAFPTVFLTAWYALCELAHPRPGAHVLVHSAAGGVGSALVQVARALDLRVVGVVGRREKVAIAEELGAEAVILREDASWSRDARRAAPEGYDVVLDANGPSTLRASYALLRPTGRLVAYGFHSMLGRSGGRPHPLRLLLGWLRTPRFDPLAMTNANRSVLAFNLSFLFARVDLLREAMDRLLGWAREGRIRPPPVTRIPFDEVAEAHRRIESGATTGKLVLTMDA